MCGCFVCVIKGQWDKGRRMRRLGGGGSEGRGVDNRWYEEELYPPPFNDSVAQEPQGL